MSTFMHTAKTDKRDWREAVVYPGSLVAAHPQFIGFAGYQPNEHPPSPMV